MSKIVFISYNHKQGDWVLNNLLPCLRAGGAEVRIDIERFRAGKEVVAQMDAEQDVSDLSVLVLSPEYLASAMCRHEMQHALARNKFVAVLRADCAAPDEVKKTLYVDLRDDKAADKWDLLLRECEADLGAAAPDWLYARDEIVRRLRDDYSVNLVVPRVANHSKPKWRELLAHIQKDFFPEMGEVDLQRGVNTARHGLVNEMLLACGASLMVPKEPDDLIVLARYFEQRPTPARLALTHFDMVVHRPNYEVNLFAALRHLMTERRKLALLIHSRTHFVQLLPAHHPLSSITNLITIELHGRP